LVEAIKGVKIQSVLSTTGGYLIVQDDNNNLVRNKAREFLNDEKVKNALDKLTQDFGGFCAKDLELRSTIVYVDRDMKQSGNPLAPKGLEELVQEIKPYFKANEISQAIAELESKGYLAGC
jgi:hypothetical protein